MTPPWTRLPVRLRAALAALGLLCALFLLWWLSGWAWPTRELAHRAQERSHLFGPGELVARGEIVLSEDAWGRRGTDFLVSRSGDRFAVSVLSPKWRLLWQGSESSPWPFYVLSPTQEDPLSYSFLELGVLTAVSEGRSWTDGLEYLLLVASIAPEVVRVEVTMGVAGRAALEQDPDWLDHHGVTAPGEALAPGLWTARLRLIGQTSGTTLVRLRGYDAAGALRYDSGPPERS